MTAATAATIPTPQMVLSRKNHEPLLVQVIVARLNVQGPERLLFPIHEFIAGAVCYLYWLISSHSYSSRHKFT